MALSLIKLLRKKIILSPFTAILIAVLLLILDSSKVLMPLQLTLADHLYKPSGASSDIVLVSIDDATIAKYGHPSTWDRTIVADALRKLDLYKPKVIAFDMFYRDPHNAEGDSAFADAIDKAVTPIIISMPHTGSESNDGIYHSNQSSTDTLPLQIFLKNTVLSSMAFEQDLDKVFRKVIPVIYDETNKRYIESFPFAVSRIALNLPLLGQQPKSIGNKYLLDPSYIAVPLEDGKMLINFFSSRLFASSASGHRYPEISFLTLVDDTQKTFNLESLRDKIVLIGTTNTASEDSYNTPVSASYRMPGVEVHANAIQTILDKKFLRYMSPWEQILLIILLSFISVFVFIFTRVRWSLLYLVGMAGGYTLLAPVLFDHGLIVDLVHPYLALFGAFVSVYVYRYVTEFRSKLELKNAFSKYVNPAIVNQLMAHPEQLKLGGEKREVTVIFTDIRGFTSISEKLKPESLVALLNEYFEKMSDVVFEEGGTVDKYEGDAILAFFGAPLPQQDHAVRACRTVLKMRKALAELNSPALAPAKEVLKMDKELAKLNSQWKAPTLPGGEIRPQIDFRAGINSGEVIVGNVGSSKKLNYTVMGDNVNLASRLEGANKKYGTNILISDDTFALVKDFFVSREIDMIKVVGKTHPVRVHELLADKSLLDEHADFTLLKLYAEGINLYKNRKFAQGLAKFDEILKFFPDDGPSQLYRQRCEVLRDFPPKPDWDGVYEMGEK